MGREARRVPLDFDWPARKVWDGYLTPDRFDEDRCPTCGGDGTTDAARWLMKIAYVLSECADDHLTQGRGLDMHPWLRTLREVSYGSGGSGRPGTGFTEVYTALTGIEPDRGVFGSDTYKTYRALTEKSGLRPEWDHCPGCSGHGSTERYPGQRTEAEAWEPTEPPTGSGWQMWETTSEGSPVSPVFATAEELADWLAPNATVFGDMRADRDHWLSIITGHEIAAVQIAPGVIAM